MGAPERTRTYVNHHLDSNRWDGFVHRPDDIIISTSYKCGTTWTQRIVSLLLLGTEPLPPGGLNNLSPWIDARWMEPLDGLYARLESQSHRRFVKSHLPLDALPYWPDVKYIAVGRDSRDVFMSVFNHWSGYTDFTYQLLDGGDPPGGPMPKPPTDPRDAWGPWITKGNFEWETDGFPMWSHHYHINSFFQHRNLDNILLVHYADMKADLDGEMRRIARFLDIDVDESAWPALVHAATFDAMKEEAQNTGLDMIFEGGADRFFFKGTNGRWRDVLTADDLALYENAASKLDPELRTWLENGRLSAEGQRSG